MKYQQYSPGRSEVRRWDKRIRAKRCDAVVIFFLRITTTSAILDGLEKLLGQDLTDEHFISTNINMSSFKFAIDRLADRRVNDVIPVVISVRGRGAGGGLQPPRRKKISIIRAKLMYHSGKDTVKNILLFNILIYLFSSRNSPNLLTDLCTTSWDGCYYSELEHWVLLRDWEW